jgi:NTP pyrophosphatase (non-canonical NTP hydrolase)
MEAELVPPTKEEAYELFDEFNDKKGGRLEENLEKEEF